MAEKTKGNKRIRDHQVFHLFMKVLGYILLVIGAIGLIMPILPGWALIIVGLMILGEESSVGKRVIHRLPQRFQKHFKKADQVEPDKKELSRKNNSPAEEQ